MIAPHLVEKPLVPHLYDFGGVVQPDYLYEGCKTTTHWTFTNSNDSPSKYDSLISRMVPYTGLSMGNL